MIWDLSEEISFRQVLKRADWGFACSDKSPNEKAAFRQVAKRKRVAGEKGLSRRWRTLKLLQQKIYCEET